MRTSRLAEIAGDARRALSIRAVAISKQAEIVGQQLLTVWNVGAGALEWIADECGEVTRDTWSEVKKGIPKGVGRGVEKAAEGGVKLALLLFAVKLAGPLGVLALLVPSFRGLARGAKKIEQISAADAE